MGVGCGAECRVFVWSKGMEVGLGIEVNVGCGVYVDCLAGGVNMERRGCCGGYGRRRGAVDTG